MLNLSTIKTYYPPKLHNFPLGILREYFQYKILETIYSSKLSLKLIFMGGTALRIVHDNQRFSEDLDFDNRDLSKNEFEELSELVKKALELEGYQVEIKNVYKEVFHCYIKIPELLYQEGLSGFLEEKIVIRIDTTPQNYDYESSLFLLDRFNIYQNIKVVPIDLLMSQKFTAILERKTTKARDLFDTSYLFSLGVQPDMSYIKLKLGFNNKDELKEAVIKHLESMNMGKLADNVRRFLFDPNQISRIINFIDCLNKLK